MPVALSPQQRQALHVLGFLYLRMGLPHKAERIFAVLHSSAEKKATPAHTAALGLALLEQGEAEKAVGYIRKAIGIRQLATHEAPLHLLLAQALWAANRKPEAQEAVTTFLYLTGNK